jgi:linoleoyl-CoA desaturase
MANPLLLQILPDSSDIKSARTRLHWKAASIAGVLLIGYLGVMTAHTQWQRLLWAVVLVHGAVAMATGVMHDANHGSFSSVKRVNTAFAWTADLLGASSHLWRLQHNVAHHKHTNIQGRDKDLQQDPLARLAPLQTWHPWHRAQQWYMWPLYGFLQVKWFLIGDWMTLVQLDSVQRRRLGWRVLLGKLLHATWAVALPLAFHGWKSVVVWYLACSWAVGFALAVVFQMAHAVDEAEFMEEAGPITGDAMFAHQLATTVDVQTRSVVRWYCAWLMGGLDHQVEHHLAPRVPHTAYSAMAKTVKSVASANSLRYRSHSSLRGAVASHWRWLREMGRRPEGLAG